MTIDYFYHLNVTKRGVDAFDCTSNSIGDLKCRFSLWYAKTFGNYPRDYLASFQILNCHGYNVSFYCYSVSG